MVAKAFFTNVPKKNKTFGQKNVLWCSKMPKIAPLNTIKLLSCHQHIFDCTDELTDLIIDRGFLL